MALETKGGQRLKNQGAESRIKFGRDHTDKEKIFCQFVMADFFGAILMK